jgi:hypothetical protein
VLADWSAKTRLALERLEAHGCHRIALTINRAILDIADGIPLAEFLRWRHGLPGQRQVEPWIPDAYDAAGLVAWFRRERPDGIVTIMDQTAGLFRDQGITPPPILLLGPECGRGAHLREDLEDTGARAVDLLAQLVARDERGLPSQALTLLTPVHPCPVCTSLQ